ncbi:MAG: methionine--tRNA ligase [Bacilli bacterium]|nr:methionine--tRNA ligase [Bacilli bacterium]
MNIFIGISWPFANGDLHIDHAASSISGDVLARYYRLRGDKVILVSGTDAHGTPIEIQSLKEGKSQKEIADECHKKFLKDWCDLGISFDLYNRTDDEYHKEFVRNQFKKYYNNGYLYEKSESQLYCDKCKLFLADRYIVGICPKCGVDIKGDECEKCNSLLSIDEVKETKCAICGNKTIFKSTKNLYFALSRFQSNIETLCEVKKEEWRNNAVEFTRRYLSEGIPDRCATRSLKWGIDIPISGFKNKKIYGWFENVWGYVTASKKYCEEHNLNFEEFWKNGYDNKIYLVHAKDNIPFHTVIFPSLLLATEENYKLPDKILSDYHLTIEGEKLSKSKGNYISLRYLIDRYPADSLRYFFLANESIKKDFNFSWNDFIHTHNGELLGKWGNFINRTLLFVNKAFDGCLEEYVIDQDVEKRLKKLFEVVGKNIEDGNCKDAINSIFDFISYANKYFDLKQPWILVNEDKKKCEEVLFNCVNIIYNVNTLLKPFLPFSCDKVDEYLGLKNNGWKYEGVDVVKIKTNIEPLYIRYDKRIIEEEVKKLKR